MTSAIPVQVSRSSNIQSSYTHIQSFYYSVLCIYEVFLISVISLKKVFFFCCRSRSVLPSKEQQGKKAESSKVPSHWSRMSPEIQYKRVPLASLSDEFKQAGETLQEINQTECNGHWH